MIVITDKGSSLIEQIIRDAERYVYIASFLFYDEKLCEILIQKHKSTGVSMELLTTPPEAAESDELKGVSGQIQDALRKNNIKVIPCDWEVGQPELTISTRAGGRIPRWFALHTKFVVTDKHALITSADITQTFSKDGNWDTYEIYTDDKRISSLRHKYEDLKNFFSDVSSRIESSYLDLTISNRNLIKGYPYSDEEPSLNDGFYFTPHEVYGRKIIEKAIAQSEQFIYCVFETIYDDEFARVMARKLMYLPHIDFRILSSPLSAYVQNPAKVRATFLQLTSYGAKIRTLKNLRAKAMITDKAVLCGSFDLAKMGIGTIRRLERGRKAVVGSTEIMDINTDKGHIEEAKGQFLKLFDKTCDEYGLWFQKDAEEILRLAGAKSIAREAKEFLGSLIFNEGTKSLRRVRKISLISVEISKLQYPSRPYIKPGHIQKAEQLLILQQKNQLTSEDLCEILGVSNAEPFLERLKTLKVFH